MRAYGDVWYNFGAGSDWTVGKTLIDALRNNNDPRLPKYAKPAKGGTVVIEAPTGPEADFIGTGSTLLQGYLMMQVYLILILMVFRLIVLLLL